MLQRLTFGAQYTLEDLKNKRTMQIGDDIDVIKSYERVEGEYGTYYMIEGENYRRVPGTDTFQSRKEVEFPIYESALPSENIQPVDSFKKKAKSLFGFL